MNIKRLIGIIVIAIGIGLIGFSFYARWDTNKENNKSIDKFEEVILEKKKGKTNGSVDLNDGIGIISIPKIDLKVIIKEGTDMKTLRRAVGHFEGTPMPWENGNFAIAGHRQYTYGEFFNRVDEIETGDLIEIQTLNGKFDYKVDVKKEVEATQVEVLDNTPEDKITIVTCVKGGKKRVVLTALKVGDQVN
ncbi:class D sortase [Metaclostridioides mangenotii]|uniref:class D sortase n=1 Tax=Metaclostridioides mangenotii TaxID=1540 RepID=UPI000465810D|nr:class D sortase [Clostridioides mangenotii]